MQTRISKGTQWAVVGLIAAALSVIKVTGQDASAAATALNSAGIATSTQTAPVQLSVGVWDVLKLVRSNIGENTIVAFINNSGQAYNLGAPEIIYLRGQGVSEGVITAMLNQRNKAPAATAPVPNQWAAPSQPAAPSATTAPAVASYPTTAPVYVQPSTVYVAPPAPVYSYYYPDYPYYYSPFSLSLGFGFGFGHGYYGGHGGYHGGHH